MRLKRLGWSSILASMRSESPKHLAHGACGKWDGSGVLLDESVARGRADPREFFDNGRPIELEIGTGKGTFLLARARQRPDLNFLGIEWARAYCLYSADRFRRAGLPNVRMLRADAGAFVRNCLPTRPNCERQVFARLTRNIHQPQGASPRFAQGTVTHSKPDASALRLISHTAFGDFFATRLAQTSYDVSQVIHECSAGYTKQTTSRFY